MKNIIKKILAYLLNKTGYFIIIDVEKISKNTDWDHYSMNISFWGKKKTLDAMFINGEPADVQEFGIWSRHLQAEEVKGLIKGLIK